MARYADPLPWEDISSHARRDAARAMRRVGMRHVQEATHAACQGDSLRAARRASDAEAYLAGAAHLGLPLTDAQRRNLAHMRAEVSACLNRAGDAVAEVMP